MTDPSPRLALTILLTAGLLAAACNERRAGPGVGTPDTGTGGCTTAAQCDDSIACTDDRCGAGACMHQALHTSCPMGQICNPRMGGCQPSTICSTPADCVDMDPCTAEDCDPGTRLCTFDPLDGDGDGFPPLVCGGTDCDDGARSIHPGTPDICGDGIDNDCDGVIDPPPCGMGGIGTPCMNRADCDAARGEVCLVPFAPSVCTIMNCDAPGFPVDGCAPGVCHLSWGCLMPCATASECHAPLACSQGSCFPMCEFDSECLPGWSCTRQRCTP